MDKLPLLKMPRPYQIEAKEWFFGPGRSSAIIADEMGLGKTAEAYMIWRKAGYPTPALLIAGKNAQVAWLNQAADWGCPKPVIVRGQAVVRAQLWAKHGLGFVTTTRESLKRDIARGVVKPEQFRAVFVDECHKDANKKTGNYNLLKAVTKSAALVLLMSGSFGRRGPMSMWANLNVVRPKDFRSYWGFVERYHEVNKNGMFGWEIGEPINQDELKQRLANVVLRRTKAEVRPQMPPKTRDLTSNMLEMTPDQASLYNAIAEQSMAELGNGDVVTASSLLARIQRLRQVLVSPKLLDPTACYGAGIDRIVELLEDATSTHMAIFSPFATALPIIKQRLLEEGYSETGIITLRGGLTVEEITSQIERFKRTKGIALCSIKFAESFDLIPATWGVFLGYEWDAWDNLQAEDRLHRGEITDPVTLYYLTYREGIDRMLMMPCLDEKVNNAMAILKDLEKVRQMLKMKVRPQI